MTPLLPLEVRAAGTADIESMACFMARLADLHGATTYQLVNYLRGLTGIYAFGKKPEGRCNGRNSLLLSGLGEGAASAVRWLDAGLGPGNWASLTLLVFSDVLPLYGTGALRPHRAWCPMCVAEMRSRGEPEYDKLIWQLRVMFRCPTHDTLLRTECPNCGQHQMDYWLIEGSIMRCRRCSSDLANLKGHAADMRRPAACEFDLANIIASKAAQPDYCLVSGSPGTFFAAYAGRVSGHCTFLRMLRKAGVSHLNFRKPGYRPALDTLITLSVLTEVPLQLILEEPLEAAKVARLDHRLAYQPTPRPRRFHTKEKREAFKASLDVELAKGSRELVRPLKGLCRSYGIGSATAEYWYPGQCSRLVARYKREIAQLRSSRAELARQVLAKDGLPKYQMGELSQHDDVVDLMHRLHGLSKSLLRRELSSLLGRG